MGMFEKRRRGLPLPLVAILLVAGGAIAAWHFYTRNPPAPPPAPVVTAEAREYIRNGGLKLDSVEMSAKESFAGSVLVEITGSIANAGTRSLKLVEVNCVFYDPFGQVVMRERVPIVSARMGGLKPGEIKAFRLPFDTLPETWNQGLPQLVIAQIVFDE